MRLLSTCSPAIFLFTAFVLFSISICAQDTTSVSSENPNQLTYEKSGGGLMVQQKGKNLNQNELFDLLNEDAEASVYVGSYKTKNVAGSILGGVGGALIGFPVGQAIGGGEPLWVLALAGAGVIAVAIPIAISAGKDIRKGIDVYNQNLDSSAQHNDPVIRVGAQQFGVGLALRF